MRRHIAMVAVLMGLGLVAARQRKVVIDEPIDLDEVVFTIDEAAGPRRAALVAKLAKMDDPRIAEALVQVLVRPRPGDTAVTQDLAYKALYRVRSKAIVPELRTMLDSDKSQQVAYAIRLLGRTLGPDSLPLLRPHARSQGVALEAFVRALGETGSPEAVRLLEATLRRAGVRSDISVFIRMSLIRLGDTSQLKQLIVQYQRMIQEAFFLKKTLKLVDSALKKKRQMRRIKYLWTVQRELRAYFIELPAKMVPHLVDAVESVDSDDTIQLVIGLVQKMMDRERAPKFAGMLDSRYAGLRRVVIREYLDTNDAGLRKVVQASVRRHLAADEWPHRRSAVMYCHLLPEAERLSALRRAATDKNVWVRAEAVRVLGRWRTPQALALIRKVAEGTHLDELRFICRCALRGIDEDLCGIR